MTNRPWGSIDEGGLIDARCTQVAACLLRDLSRSQTPRDLAEQKGFSEMAELLKEHEEGNVGPIESTVPSSIAPDESIDTP